MSARAAPAADWERAEAAAESLPEPETPREEPEGEALLALLAQAQRTLRQGYGQRG